MLIISRQVGQTLDIERFSITVLSIQSANDAGEQFVTLSIAGRIAQLKMVPPADVPPPDSEKRP